jgi:hypothetical protein
MPAQLTMQGTVRDDGTLELDAKVLMPPGRVLVTVQPAVPPAPDDPFWQRMDRIWANQKARGHVPRSGEEVEAERRILRQEMEQEVQEAIQLQEKCRQRRAEAEAKDKSPP